MNEVITGSTTNNFIEGSNRRWNRKWENNVARDLDELIPEFSQREIISNSRRLYANHGIVKGAITQKAMYSVGRGFIPRFLGRDKDWKKTATEWLTMWFQNANISGVDFQTTLYLASVAVDRDGDCFLLLTETDGGYPQIQMIPSHRVGNRGTETTVASGRYRGLKIRKGIIFQKNGRPVAYKVLGDSQDTDKIIPSSSIIHLYDPEYPEQTRGIALFAHALNEFKDMKTSSERELTAQLLLASIAFVEHNPYGEDESNAVNNDHKTIDGNPTQSVYEDGTIRFFKSGDGSKLEAITNNRPSAEYQAFHDRLERIALVGANWPKAMVDSAQGNGTADRISLRIAMRSVEDRQALLKPAALRVCVYALAKAINNGTLTPNEEFYKWSFSYPPSISIDAGRDSNALREEYKLGIRNLTDILEEQGKNLEDHLYQRAYEVAHARIIAREIAAEMQVDIPSYDMKLLSQSELNNGTQNNNENL